MAYLLFLVLDRLLVRLPVGGLELARDDGQGPMRDRVRYIAEIFRIERQEQTYERVLRRLLDEPLADDARDLDESTSSLFGRRLLLHQTTIVRPQGLEHEGEIGAVHGAHELPELGQVLSVLQAFEEIAFRALLTMHQRFEHAMLVEQTRHLVETLLQTRFRSDRHGKLLLNGSLRLNQWMR